MSLVWFALTAALLIGGCGSGHKTIPSVAREKIGNPPLAYRIPLFREEINLLDAFWIREPGTLAEMDRAPDLEFADRARSLFEGAVKLGGMDKGDIVEWVAFRRSAFGDRAYSHCFRLRTESLQRTAQRVFGAEWKADQVFRRADLAWAMENDLVFLAFNETELEEMSEPEKISSRIADPQVSHFLGLCSNIRPIGALWLERGLLDTGITGDRKPPLAGSPGVLTGGWMQDNGELRFVQVFESAERATEFRSKFEKAAGSTMKLVVIDDVSVQVRVLKK